MWNGTQNSHISAIGTACEAETEQGDSLHNEAGTVSRALYRVQILALQPIADGDGKVALVKNVDAGWIPGCDDLCHPDPADPQRWSTSSVQWLPEPAACSTHVTVKDLATNESQREHIFNDLSTTMHLLRCFKRAHAALPAAVLVAGWNTVGLHGKDISSDAPADPPTSWLDFIVGTRDTSGITQLQDSLIRVGPVCASQAVSKSPTIFTRPGLANVQATRQ